MKIKHNYKSIEGWFNMENQYKYLMNNVEDRGIFVELGAYKGKSTSFIVTEIINSGKKIKFYTVDTFQGVQKSSDFKEINAYKSLKISKMKEEFLENTKHINKYFETIVELSDKAAERFEDNSVDVIFIDAGHSYESVKSDLTSWFPKMKKKSIMSGHDYQTWGGVKKAVDEYFGKVKKVENNCWFVDIDKCKNEKKINNEIHPTGYWSGSSAHSHHIHSKKLSNWICNFLKDQKNYFIYDMGCGLGNYLLDLKNNGFTKLIGFEAEPPEKKVFYNIIAKNLTLPIELEKKGNVISLEVGEHIPKKYMNTYLDNVCKNCSNYLITSWAIRNQGGFGHVNCLDNYEILPEYEKRGFKLLEEETKEARKTIENRCFWFRNTLFIMKKND
jgi:hypothetical protein